MSPANLQIEGLLVVLAALLRRASVAQEGAAAGIEEALTQAMATIEADETRLAPLSASQRESLLFPARFLKAALAAPAETSPSGVIREVGRGLDRGAD